MDRMRCKRNVSQVFLCWFLCFAVVANADMFSAGDARKSMEVVPAGVRFLGVDPIPSRTTNSPGAGSFYDPMAGRGRDNDPVRWRTGRPGEKGVVYTGLYDGIDLAFYQEEKRMQYDLVVDPWSDLDQVRIAPTTTAWKVHAHQFRDGVRVPVQVDTHEKEDGTLGFEVGAYNRAQPLVITWHVPRKPDETANRRSRR